MYQPFQLPTVLQSNTTPSLDTRYDQSSISQNAFMTALQACTCDMSVLVGYWCLLDRVMPLRPGRRLRLGRITMSGNNEKTKSVSGNMKRRLKIVLLKRLKWLNVCLSLFLLGIGDLTKVWWCRNITGTKGDCWAGWTCCIVAAARDEHAGEIYEEGRGGWGFEKEDIISSWSSVPLLFSFLQLQR